MYSWEKVTDNRLFHAAAIVLIGVLCYCNTFSAPFIWDDIRLIQNNPFVRNIRFPVESLNPIGHQAGMITSRGNSTDETYAGIHDPKTAAFNREELYKTIKQRYVGSLTFALNYAFDGFHPAGYHLFNLIIHILNGLLLYALVLLSFRTPLLLNTSLRKGRTYLALACAALFVAHPVETNAVTYIYQRFASLAACFTLLSLVFYIQSRLSPDEYTDEQLKDRAGRRPKPAAWKSVAWYCASVASLVLGMKTKENVFLAPFAIALYELFFFDGPLGKRLKRLIPLSLTLLIIPYSYLISMDRGIGAVAREFDVMHYNRADYFLTQIRVVATYLRLLFWPAHLTLDYDYPVFTTFWTVPVVLSFVLHIALLCCAGYLFLRSRRGDQGYRLVSFGILWFYLFLSMESSIFTFSQVIMEYRLYLPSVGFFLSVVPGLWHLLAKQRHQTILAAFLGLSLTVLAAATYARNAVWSNEELFWKDNIEESPAKFVPYVNLAVVYKKQGRLEEALQTYESVVRLKPDFPDAYAAMGDIYRSLGRHEDAMRMADIAVAINPESLAGHELLGILYDDADRHDDALREFGIALRIAPDHAKAHIDCGIAYFFQRHPQLALREFKTAVELEPDSDEAHFDLALVDEELGRDDDASSELEKVLTLNPSRSDARRELDTVRARLLLKRKSGDLLQPLPLA